MDIQSFAQDLEPAERAQFCKLAGTNSAYLSQLVSGHRNASPDLARRLVKASRELFETSPERWLTLSGVRKDIWSGDAA